MSNPRHSLVGGVLHLYRDAVNVFYNTGRLDLREVDGNKKEWKENYEK